MSEQQDNTTEQDESSLPESIPKDHSYYEDDSTGYEVYDPEKDEDDEAENGGEAV